ncbi:hypothetical protein [Clostridium cellulovorans]|uniref:Virulence-related protein n=1 Tax=Clostridium cellulovorans (strain ATCC 35296 / DSM 3052 / OCM 3 / 743B) TaxID=573061 RepID=D9SLL0_CLOC7|nr:hypothetical protein [Clostridium cellulovorans]ADL53647.1 virulence-related protein [Clostridium cellulovorans 743B]
MVLHFNVSGDARKKMVKAIEKELGVKAKYLGVPSCAYQIDIFRVEKDGTLSWEDLNDTDPVGIEKSSRVVDACVMETGNSPTEWDETTETNELIISVLKEGFTDEAIDNLFRILESKGRLFSSAFKKQSLVINVKDDKIEFPWFSELDPQRVQTYTKFVTAICEMAKNQKRITAKPREDENEKYAFRCFLLRLGFIGDEFKADRKILLENLDGSSAFKKQKEE